MSLSDRLAGRAGAPCTWLALAALSLAGTATAQDPPPPLLPPPPAVPTDPWADLPRGVLPDGTDEGTRAQFAALRAALAPLEAGRPPLTRFWLKIELHHRGEEQSNSLRGKHSYLAPSYVQFEAEGHAMGLGPEGYWKRDGERHIPLEGREYKVDRDSIDEMLAISRNFVELLDPARWRVVAASALAEPVKPLPDYKHLRYDPDQLAWLAIDTPDFRLPREAGGDGAPRLYRVTLGCERGSGRPTFALVQELRGGKALSRGSLCVYLGGWWTTDGHALPQYVTAHRALPPTPAAVLAFEDRPTWEFGMLAARLDPELTPAQFLGR